VKFRPPTFRTLLSWRNGDGISLRLPYAKRLIDGLVTVLAAQLADVLEECLVELLSPFRDLDYQAGGPLSGSSRLRMC
jgi:hypothetical protein